MQNNAAARATLQQLNAYSATLPQELSTEIDNYCAINNIYLNSLTNGLIDTSVLTVHKEELLDAALSESWLYSAQAKALYSYLTDTLFPEYTPLPEDVLELRKSEAKQDISDIFSPVLKVYPNPNNGLLFIEYDFDKNYEAGYDILFEAIGKNRAESCEKGFVNIYTIEGKLVKTENLENKKGLKTIDMVSLPNGMYILEIADCYGNNISEKINKE
ncbi:T9SS type A sorting domain-containing protein [Bacteroidales bacterium OttesenSCG-928-I21]|nr:T9SS type A sorting domain-containing protein [Bacteroidales bacterium OttesenSCG-928-I21]